MQYVELTLQSLAAATEALTKQICRNYQPDCVVYIAQAGLPVAQPISRHLGVPLVGIRAFRRGNGAKQWAAPLLRRLPRGFTHLLRRVELALRQARPSPRHRGMALNLADTLPPAPVCRVLLVDDSVDTGATMLCAQALVRQRFLGCEVRCAALNTWRGSARHIKTEYTVFHNTILITPMSRDSAEYPAFLQLYGAQG